MIYSMKKLFLIVPCLFFFIIGILILSGFFDPGINNWVMEKIGRYPGNKSMLIFRYLGVGLIIFSIVITVFIIKSDKLKTIFRTKLLPFFSRIDIWLERIFSKFINFSHIQNEISWKSVTKLDLLFLFFALLFSFLLVIERLQGNYPDVILGSDAANISSMAIALENPDLFEEDFYLQDQDNFKLYFQLHVVIIRILGKLLNNYTLPFVVILGPTALLILLGNYWLGRTITNNRFWAFLFVLFNSIPVYLLFENWGLSEDAVPRTLMQAILPFILTLLWLWRNHIRRWPLIAIFTGLLTYIHAVGTPTIMALVILSFFCLMPNDWTLRKKIISLIILSIIMLLVGSIFIGNYLSIKQQVEPFDYETIINLYRTYFPPNILDVNTSAGLLLKFYWKTWILPFGLLGLIILWLLKFDSRKLSKLLFAWLLGIFIVSLLIPFVERIVESYLRILPIETELIRGTRFFVPTLGLLSIASLSQLSQVIRFRIVKILLGVIGIIFIVNYFSYRSNDFLLLEKTRACIQQGQIICTEKSDLQNLLNAIDEKTPQKTSIFFSNNSRDTLPLAIRYISNRSLVYSWKDRGFGFSHPNKMIEWHEIFTVIDQYPTTAEWYQEDPEDFVDFIKKLNANYLVITKNNLDIVVKIGDLIYENQSYLLIRVD